MTREDTITFQSEIKNMIKVNPDHPVFANCGSCMSKKRAALLSLNVRDILDHCPKTLQKWLDAKKHGPDKDIKASKAWLHYFYRMLKREQKKAAKDAGVSLPSNESNRATKPDTPAIGAVATNKPQEDFGETSVSLQDRFDKIKMSNDIDALNKFAKLQLERDVRRDERDAKRDERDAKRDERTDRRFNVLLGTVCENREMLNDLDGRVEKQGEELVEHRGKLNDLGGRVEEQGEDLEILDDEVQRQGGKITNIERENGKLKGQVVEMGSGFQRENCRLKGQIVEMGSSFQQQINDVYNHVSQVTGTPVPANRTNGYAVAEVSTFVTPGKKRRSKREQVIQQEESPPMFVVVHTSP